MNKKKKTANKKHRKSKARLKALRVASLVKMKKRPKPVEKKVEEKAEVKKPATKKTTAKKTTAKKTTAKKTTAKKD